MVKSTELSAFIITRLGAVSSRKNATSLHPRTTLLYTASEKMENGSDFKIHFNIGNLEQQNLRRMLLGSFYVLDLAINVDSFMN